MRSCFRLKRSDEFQRCYRRGKAYHEALIVMHVYDRRDEQCARIGFSVGRRVGKAVKRNLVKRWMREAIRPHYTLLPKGVDIVFSARARAADVGFWPLKEGMLKLLRRAGILSKEANLSI